MEALIHGITTITLGQIAMMLIGALLMYLGIKKEYEPTLFIPMGLGAILVNFPGTGVLTPVVGGTKAEGMLDVLFKAGINTELFPLLIFIGIGAMIDFGPLLQNPFMLLFGAAKHGQIFATVFVAVFFGFNIKEAASIGIIGAAERPDFDFRFEPTCAKSVRGHHSRCVFVYGIGADHPANGHQGSDHKAWNAGFG